jgi:hypothetical protein
MVLKQSEIRHCYELMKISKAIYPGPTNQRILSFTDNAFVNQKYVHGSYGRGYCRIFWNQDTAVIAFRGTRESIDWLISNFTFWPSKLSNCICSETVKVHFGFQKALYFKDKSSGCLSFDQIIHLLDSNELLNKRIVVTGHSLGGGMAIIFATKLRERFPNQVKDNLAYIITFGCPPPGNLEFRHFYKELNQKTIGIVNNSDVVPLLPPAGYCHVGRQVMIDNGVLVENPSHIYRFKKALCRAPWCLGTDHMSANYLDQLERLLES